jgi:hypothetical protein
MPEQPRISLLDWILKVVRDEESFARLTTGKGAEEMIRGSELTDAQKAALLSRDPDRIRGVIEYELGMTYDELKMHTGPIYFVLPFPIPMHNGLSPPE